MFTEIEGMSIQSHQEAELTVAEIISKAVVKASAPGSLMLLGEYGVLHGKQALVCAIDQRMTVYLTPRSDKIVKIHSILGTYESTLYNLKLEKPFHFVLGALKLMQPRMKQGCHLCIESSFAENLGLGSSAAVTIAVLAALNTWLNMHVSPLDLLRKGRDVVREAQGGKGSGADIAASVFGGVVSYQTMPLWAQKYACAYPLTVWYTGYKTPTAEAIQKVEESFKANPRLLQHLMQTIGQCAIDGAQCLSKNDWQGLGWLMNIQQGLMQSLGVSETKIEHMLEVLRAEPNILGAKISGSGLGDCVIGLGGCQQPTALTDVTPLSLSISKEGAMCEKI